MAACPFKGSFKLCVSYCEHRVCYCFFPFLVLFPGTSLWVTSFRVRYYCWRCFLSFTNMILYTFLLLVGVVLGVLAQFSLKKGMDRAAIAHFRQHSLFVLIRKVFWNRFVLLGSACYAVSLLLWLVILSKLELSYAYPMISSGYFFVVLGSRFIFKEKVSWQRWLSILVIMLGVVLVGLS